jgi:hypothetical protein
VITYVFGDDVVLAGTLTVPLNDPPAQLDDALPMFGLLVMLQLVAFATSAVIVSVPPLALNVLGEATRLLIDGPGGGTLIVNVPVAVPTELDAWNVTT